MSKEPKITIKHYLNRRMKRKGENTYSVYVQIIYKRQVTQLKSRFITEMVCDETELKSRFSAEIERERVAFEKAIRETGMVTYEKCDNLSIAPQIIASQDTSCIEHYIENLTVLSTRINDTIKMLEKTIADRKLNL